MRTLVLEFHTYEEDLTAATRIEVKAIDIRTATPVVSLPRLEMQKWLHEHGYRWVFGSSGLYEKAP